MSKVSALYHIVINTKNREMTIPKAARTDLYKYISGIVTSKQSELIAIGGIENHVHMLINLSSTISLADFMKSLKQSSSVWMQDRDSFPRFKGWGKEYFAFSVSYSAIGSVKSYIANQEEHHHRNSFDVELRDILSRLGEQWKECYLT